MKSLHVFSSIAIASLILFSGCKKDDEDTQNDGTNIPLQTTKQPTVNLGVYASTLAVLAGSEITNSGFTVITGEVGLSPGSSIGGFPDGISGTRHINDVTANTAQSDLTAAYNDAAGRTSRDMVLLSGNLGGLTLTPGLYKSSGGLEISSGDLTFDARGNANAVFIIQIASTFLTTSGRKIFLKGNASASRIFWQVGSSATFGTTSVLHGTFMAHQSIVFNTGATLNGRALARQSEVTMLSNTIVLE